LLPASLLGDPERIRLVLLNRVGNAVKFTHRRMVLIHVDRHRQDPARSGAKISVPDAGIGIRSSKIARLFEKVYRDSSSNTRRHGGTGPALAKPIQIEQLRRTVEHWSTLA
jgi:signal transduction histidine kinase